MKKKFLAVMTALLVLAMGSTTAFAATSPEAGLPTGSDYFSAVTSVEGAEYYGVSDEEVAETREYLATVNETGTVKTVIDVIGTPGVPFTVNVPSVSAGANIVVYHQLSNGTWEVVTPDSVADGKVVITLSSFSKIAIVEKTVAAATTPGYHAGDYDKYLTSDTTVMSPQTGEMATLLPLLAMISLAGVVVCGKKAMA